MRNSFQESKIWYDGYFDFLWLPSAPTLFIFSVLSNLCKVAWGQSKTTNRGWKWKWKWMLIDKTRLDPKQTLLKLFRYESKARGWMKTLFKDMSKGWRRKIKKMITENLKGFLFTLNELSSNNSTNQKHIEDNHYINNAIKTKVVYACSFFIDD